MTQSHTTHSCYGAGLFYYTLALVNVTDLMLLVKYETEILKTLSQWSADGICILSEKTTGATLYGSRQRIPEN